MPETTTEDLVTGLRGWVRGDAPHVQAAVELLIWHQGWLLRASFLAACVRGPLAPGLVASIDWDKARRFADSSPRCSTSERGVLHLAVALGEDLYHLSGMGTAHRQAIAAAVASAMEVDR